MSGIVFWLVMSIVFVLLWWAGFYATKDMRVKKNAMRTEQAKRNLERHAQQQAAEQQAAEEQANKAEQTKGADHTMATEAAQSKEEK